MEHFVLFRSLL